MRGSALLAGRFVGVAVVVGVFTAFAEYFVGLGGSPIVAAAVRLLFGIALMVFAVVKWLRRPRGADADEPPRWMSSLEGISGWGAVRLGLVVSILNPKEIALGAGAGLVIGGVLYGFGESVAAVAIYAAIASLTVAAPVIAVLIAGSRVTESLGDFRTWLVRNNTTVVAVVMLVFGAILFGDGLGGLNGQ
ncbi:GAP family protein [Leifsonia poae]|uniref:GAP family protein n=1 Tax=Leifsonia poae TaxID=110933 RepID=UPI003D667170